MRATTTTSMFLPLVLALLAALPRPAGGRTPARRPNSWPRDPALLLERLNSWDKDEVDAAERPRAHGRRIASGETNGWIGSHKRSLRALGYAVRWDRKQRRYRLHGRAAKDWREKNPRAYLGRYQTDVFVDSDPSDRAAGRGGSGIKVRASIELGQSGTRWTATYRVTPVDRPRASTAARLSDVRIQSNQLATNPIVIKTAWPYYVPALFEGRFVEPRGLVFDGRLYRRLGRKGAFPGGH